MTRPFCVGLTGGIGSGKSVVAALFAEMGAAVVDTDLIARELTGPGGAAMPAIVEAFGKEMQALDGALDRPRMRRYVFTDETARHRLEVILHPLIREEAARRVGSVRAPYVVLVVPLLVETGAYESLVNRILVVDCDEAQQVSRVCQRDAASEALAQAVLAAQSSRESRLAVADDVIDNRGELAGLRSQVKELHARYLKMSVEAGWALP